MSIKPVQNQFNGGEISPLMDGRFDMPVYHQSADIFSNFVPVSEGCFKRRGGSHFVSTAKQTAALSFEIVPTPSDATVTIDGEWKSSVECAYGDKISYSVEAKDYTTVTGNIILKENTTLPITLVSTTDIYTFEIDPTPADANVIINGIERSSIDIGRNGTVEWQVKKDGYDIMTGSEVVVADKTLEVELTCTYQVICIDDDQAIITINGETTDRLNVVPGETVTWTVTNGTITKTGTETATGSMINYVFLDDSVRVFNYTGALQTYTVPRFINKLEIDVVGARGANDGGYPGRVQCLLSVTPEDTLYLYVATRSTSTSSASYNASDIRRVSGTVTDATSLASRLIVAGGGGNGGSGDGRGRGGNGGDIIADSGNDAWPARCGSAGTSSTGGVGGGVDSWTSQVGAGGGNGGLGMGGNGGYGLGGAGGAGYYGGGGGGGVVTKSYGSDGAGGGGGSSYTAAGIASNVVHTKGYVADQGYITIRPIYEG